jgi:hypothetical protein
MPLSYVLPTLLSVQIFYSFIVFVPVASALLAEAISLPTPAKLLAFAAITVFYGLLCFPCAALNRGYFDDLALIGYFVPVAPLRHHYVWFATIASVLLLCACWTVFRVGHRLNMRDAVRSVARSALVGVSTTALNSALSAVVAGMLARSLSCR